ncbi:UDP-N-acetyl-D-mannosamine dehydrogenase [Chromohalobacter israelensis]|uniref:UDP-N-acetyl-D-mannosamine dehydrogenase n=1 Tax=Chromohalobacter israelensis TaxID=141390 RepID=UPI00265C8256|nr:UDP-N-acetyl-D-mannosamine dehydrogenase [Chromohalobacter salexigens]MDO0946701.1 UDP-N-acetyl-D-mannosamine dehydrogenase [Chromohalobacter salexigens]
MNFHKICVIGLGYIGLPTAAVIAARQRQVIGVDIDEKAVETINRGEIHIVEPDLDMLVHAAVKEGYLKATTHAETADVYLIAVPTPLTEENQPDLSFVDKAVHNLAPVLKRGDLVILESTSPVGTTERLAGMLAEKRPDLSFPLDAGSDADVNIAHCPERVMPGQVIHELVHNDRIVGGVSPRCAERARSFYELFVSGKCITADVRSAEMCKLAENSFRDVNIAFANELSTICEKLGVPVWELINLANLHPRVNILNPGPGVGGHCIAIDPWFVVSQANDEANLIRQARHVNDTQPSRVIAKVMEGVSRHSSHHSNVTIGLLGLAYKANTDDLRNSPAFAIANALAHERRVTIMAVEPHLRHRPESLDRHVELVSLEDACQADIVVALVPHRQFHSKIHELQRRDHVIDVCGLLNTL